MEKTRNRTAGLTILLVLLLSAVLLTAGSTRAYAASDGTDPVPASGTWGTCAWDIDADGVLTIHSGTGVYLKVKENAPWYNYRKNIKSVKTSGTIKCPGSLGSLFLDCSNMTTADLSGFDTSETTSLQKYSTSGQNYGIFTKCSSLKTITGLDRWDTSNFNNLSAAFMFCSSLTSISGLENWDVSKVSAMEATFMGTESLTDFSPLSGWKTTSLKNLNRTFENSGLKDLSVFRNWNTSKVTIMHSLFFGCSQLSDMSGLENWDTSSCKEITEMFMFCNSLKEITVPANWNLNNVTDTYATFSSTSISKITFSDNFKIPAVQPYRPTWYTNNPFGKPAYTYSGKESDGTWGLGSEDAAKRYTAEELYQYGQSHVLTGTWYAQVKKDTAAQTWTVHFDANGGSGQMADQTITTGTATALTANAFSRTGYTFTGWNTAADGSGTAYANQAKVTDLAQAGSSVTLYAQWKQNPPKTYTVHFDANGGSGQMADQTITAGSATALTANAFSRADYTFTGWNTAADGSGTTFTDEQQVKDLAQADGSITLYAQWKQNTPKTWTIHFDANGGSGQMADQTITAGTATALTANAFSRADYTFTGWNTAADGSGTTFTDGQQVKDLAQAGGSVTLYAQWKQNTPKTWTIHFDANGGSGQMADQTITSDTLTTLSFNSFSRDGFTFTGWNTAADGSGTTFTDGQQVQDLAQAGSTVTVYAQWAQNSTTVDYKIIKGDGQTWTKGTSTGLSMTANGPIEKFEKLLIDGSEVSSSDYTAVSGSTVVTTTAAYTESLSIGQHTLTVQYTDGSATGTFYVAAQSAAGQTDSQQTTAAAETDNVQTGYTSNSNSVLYALLLVGAAMGLTVVAVKRARR